MQQEVEEAFETLKAFQLDWLRWCQQQLVLGSSVYGNVRGESNSTNRRICQVHRLPLGSSIPVLYGSYQEDTVQRNSLFFELKGSKKKATQSGPSVYSLDLPKRQNPSSPAVQGHNPGTKNASILTQASEKELAVDLMPDTLH